MGRATPKFCWLRPLGSWGGSKGQISFNFNYKVSFKDFIPHFVCVLTNERYKTYPTGFLFCRLGHALGVGLLGYLGAKIKFRPAVCPLWYFLLNHWTKFNQIWCVCVTHMNGARNVKIFWPHPLGPWGGVKMSNII